MRTTLKLVLLAGSALVSSQALAQQQPVPPDHYTLDARGVDLVQGSFNYSTTEVVIGAPGTGGLSYGRSYVGAGQGWRDSNLGTINLTGATYTVSVGAVSERFEKIGGVFMPASNNGSTLAAVAGGYVFTASGGDVYRFTTAHRTASSPYRMNEGLLTSIKGANGAVSDYHYRAETYCRLTGPSGGCLGYTTVLRLQAITNSFGYQLKYDYESNAVGEGVPSAPWLKLKKVTGFNMAVDYCASGVDVCPAFSRVWPSVSYPDANTATDQSGRTTTYAFSGSRLSAVRAPGSAIDDVAITYDAAGLTASVTDSSGPWSYAYVLSSGGTVRTTTATGPLGQKTVAVANLTSGRATSVADALGRTTSFTYDVQGRLERTTAPEGDYARVVYDARGNVVQTVSAARPGSGLADITTSAAYPATCANPVTCNRPISTTDALGRTTDYSYDPVHGGVLSVTAPAPASGAARPQTRIAFASQSAQVKNATGGFVSYGTVTLPVSSSACVTGSSCAGTVDEVKTSIVYGSTGVANNLLPTSVTTGSGDGSLTATTAMTYTAQGDVATVDGPMAGAADTVTYRYDNARQAVGVIGPDPDGGGPLLRRAQRATYNPRGQVTLSEAGAVNGLSDGDWAAFVSLQQSAATYDAYGRPTHQGQQSGGTTHALTQVSYDAAGRADCTVARMNPSTFASPPASACDPGAPGSFGPDRIAKTGYDAAGQAISTTSGLGVDPITESVTYTANGQPLTLTDGKGNVSTIEYDGFGRPAKMRYPNPASSGSSTTDYEEYAYDAAGQVLTYRNRGGDTFTSGYDALGRQTSATGGGMPARSFTYDNLGRVTGAAIAGGASLTRTWDALGRMTSETQNPLGKTAAYQYDFAGRRTRLTWPDGFFVNYDYNVAGDLTAIRENGATSWQLANWAYDNLGRRTAQARANGATTYWSYDTAGRLGGLSHDMPGAADDLMLNFTYNPAGQIISRTMSNPAYVYAPGIGATSYVNNGKNQVTNVGGSAVSYDGRQNVTDAPMGSYAYNGLNQLTSANVGSSPLSLIYDPAGRLFQSTGGATYRFLYDGAQMVGEYDGSGNLQRRFIPGLGMDEHILTYEGAGVTDRRWMLQDERRSVVAYLNGAGATLSVNTYDEYGQPGPWNAGRFQYTGQMWLPEARLYHYKARAYAPQLGRFMQTDPIGYQAGANLYGYVGADPVNATDPTGNVAVLIPIFIGAVVGGGVEAIKQIERHGRVTDLTAVGTQALFGGATGAFGFGVGGMAIKLLAGRATAGGVVVAANVVGGMVGGGTASASMTGLNNGSPGEIVKSGLVGAITGAGGAGLGQGAQAYFKGGTSVAGGIVQWQPSRITRGDIAGVIGEGGGSIIGEALTYKPIQVGATGAWEASAGWEGIHIDGSVWICTGPREVRSSTDGCVPKT